MDVERTMEQISPFGHGTAATAVLAALTGWLPAVLTIIATVFSILWFGLCIWESRTVQHWKRNMQLKRRARKLVRYKAKEKIILAEIAALEMVREARTMARDHVEHAKSEAAAELAQTETTAAKL